MPSPLLKPNLSRRTKTRQWQGELPTRAMSALAGAAHHHPTRQLLHSKAWKAGTQPNPRNKSVFLKGEAGKLIVKSLFSKTRHSLLSESCVLLSLPQPPAPGRKAGETGSTAQEHVKKTLCAGELLGKPSATLTSSIHSIYVDLRKIAECTNHK